MEGRIGTLCMSPAVFACCIGYHPGARAYVSGSDVSWVTQEQAAGYNFYNSSAVETDPFVLLENLGVGAIRLRVWVNPSGMVQYRRCGCEGKACSRTGSADPD